MLRRVIAAIAGLALLGAAPIDTLAEQRERLAAAKAAITAARERAHTLEREAASERDAARKARAEEAAVAAQIRGSEAAIEAAQARVAIVGRLLAAQRAALAKRQAPVVRLVAAIQSFARRPAAAAVAQPGSIDDAVHVRAMLGTMLPIVAQRSAAVRAGIARIRKLDRDAQLAAQTLRAGHAQLRSERLALVRMEGEHRLRSQALGRSVLFESDRAIAMGERARDIVGQIAAVGAQAATRDALTALPGPLPRPPASGDTPDPRFALPPYRLPAAGRIVAGLGELSDAGVRSRGLTLRTAPGAPVVAPAAGRVMFARAFRSYGTLVILDHGDGWTSALTGLASVSVKAGDLLTPGAPIGRAGKGDDRRVTVELRRRGAPIDLTALIG